MTGDRRLRPSAKAVVVDGGRVLVTRNRTPGDPPDWFIFPGGGQRPGETLHRALVREVREETGLAIEPGRLLWVRELNVTPDPAWPFDPKDHCLEFMFAAELLDDHGDAAEEDQFQVAVEWLTPDQLEQVRFYPRTVLPALRALVAGEAVNLSYLGDAR